jgi:hypothetical protein
MCYRKLKRVYLSKETHCIVALLGVLLLKSGVCNGATKAFLDASAILDAWEANYSTIQTMKVNYSEKIVEVTGPYTDSLVRNEHMERIQNGKLHYVRYSMADDGFAEKDSIIERSFDGTVSKGYMPMDKMGRITSGLTGNVLDGLNHMEIYMLMNRVPLDSYKGDFPEGTPMFSALLRGGIKGGWAKVRSELEPVAGELCHVVETRTSKDSNINRIWVAHAKGMLPLRYEVVRDGEVVSKMEVLEVAKTMTDTGESYYPSKAYREINRPRGGKAKFELEAREFIPHVRVSSDTFNVDFPEGTRIRDEVAGISYVKGGSSVKELSLPRDPNSSSPGDTEPNLPKSSDKSGVSTPAEGVGTETNDLQPVGLVRQGPPKQAGPWQLIAYSLGGAAVFAVVLIWMLPSLRIRFKRKENN